MRTQKCDQNLPLTQWWWTLRFLLLFAPYREQASWVFGLVAVLLSER